MGLASLLCHSLAPSLTSFEHMNPSFSPTSPVPNTVDKALLVKSLSEDLGEIMGQELVLMHARTCFLEVRKMIATPRCTHPETVPYWSAYTLMSPFRDYFHCTKQWKGQCVSQQNKTYCRPQNETLVLTVFAPARCPEAYDQPPPPPIQQTGQSYCQQQTPNCPSPVGIPAAPGPSMDCSRCYSQGAHSTKGRIWPNSPRAMQGRVL